MAKLAGACVPQSLAFGLRKPFQATKKDRRANYDRLTIRCKKDKNEKHENDKFSDSLYRLPDIKKDRRLYGYRFTANCTANRTAVNPIYCTFLEYTFGASYDA